MRMTVASLCAAVGLILGGCAGGGTGGGRDASAGARGPGSATGSRFQVTRRTPVPGSTDAAWTRDITATFSMGVDPASLTAASFRLVGKGGRAVAGTVAYNARTKTAVFTPDLPLRPGSPYSAIISASAAVAGGGATMSMWTFTTRAVAQQSLHVTGNQIRDSRGRRVVLRGVNVVDPGYTLYYEHWKAAYFDAMQRWGVKVIRIPIHPAPFRWYERNYPGSYLSLLDWGVAWAGERGMYCILEFHSIGYPPTGAYDTGIKDPNWGEIYRYTLPELRSFWDKVSQHFAGDPRVALYDLYNEPRAGGDGMELTREAWLSWRNLAETLIDRIRVHDRRRVVLVGGLQWAYDVSFAQADPVRRPNVVYSSHVYPWSVPNDAWHKNWTGAFGNLAKTAPVLVAETGFDPNDSNPSMRGTPAGYARPLIDRYLEPRQIGWLAWCFSPSWGPTLIADWRYKPTLSGSFYRQRLLAHAR